MYIRYIYTTNIYSVFIIKIHTKISKEMCKVFHVKYSTNICSEYIFSYINNIINIIIHTYKNYSRQNIVMRYVVSLSIPVNNLEKRF